MIPELNHCKCLLANDLAPFQASHVHYPKVCAPTLILFPGLWQEPQSGQQPRAGWAVSPERHDDTGGDVAVAVLYLNHRRRVGPAGGHDGPPVRLKSAANCCCRKLALTPSYCSRSNAHALCRSDFVRWRTSAANIGSSPISGTIPVGISTWKGVVPSAAA